MFFIASKILSFMLSPFWWIAFLLLVSCLKPFHKWRKKLRITALGILLLFTNQLIYVKATELLYVKDTIKPHVQYDYIVVLGGVLELDEANKQVNFNDNADRWLQAIWSDKVHGDTIIFTSGSGKLTKPKEREALLMKRFYKGDKKVKYESESRNTYENAFYTLPLITKNQPKVLLITSASHMKRGQKCFQKLNLKVDVMSVDYDSTGDFTWADYMLPQIKTMYLWEGTLHEYIGLLTYRLKGYID